MNRIAEELKDHAPFTIFGAVAGILFMMLFRNMGHETAQKAFYVFHPLHVVLSAIATTSMYKIYQCGRSGGRCNIFLLILVGYFGSVIITTVSDSLMPFMGERMFGLSHAKPHIGFIEGWYVVNPAAFLGIALAYFYSNTKISHTGHVIISTWASLFHIIMAIRGDIAVLTYAGICLFLFLSVWIPCCVSDIVFPLLFVNKKCHKH